MGIRLLLAATGAAERLGVILLALGTIDPLPAITARPLTTRATVLPLHAFALPLRPLLPLVPVLALLAGRSMAERHPQMLARRRQPPLARLPPQHRPRRVSPPAAAHGADGAADADGA